MSTGAADKKKISDDIPFDQPIKRGDQEITSIKLRRPQSGELRGLTLVDLAQLDVNALRIILPRISMPTLTSADVDAMDPADLLAVASEVSDFLLQTRLKPAFPAA